MHAAAAPVLSKRTRIRLSWLTKKVFTSPQNQQVQLQLLRAWSVEKLFFTLRGIKTFESFPHMNASKQMFSTIANVHIHLWILMSLRAFSCRAAKGFQLRSHRIFHCVINVVDDKTSPLILGPKQIRTATRTSSGCNPEDFSNRLPPLIEEPKKTGAQPSHSTTGIFLHVAMRLQYRD